MDIPPNPLKKKIEGLRKEGQKALGEKLLKVSNTECDETAVAEVLEQLGTLVLLGAEIDDRLKESITKTLERPVDLFITSSLPNLSEINARINKLASDWEKIKEQKTRHGRNWEQYLKHANSILDGRRRWELIRLGLSLTGERWNLVRRRVERGLEQVDLCFLERAKAFNPMWLEVRTAMETQCVPFPSNKYNEFLKSIAKAEPLEPERVEFSEQEIAELKSLVDDTVNAGPDQKYAIFRNMLVVEAAKVVLNRLCQPKNLLWIVPEDELADRFEEKPATELLEGPTWSWLALWKKGGKSEGLRLGGSKFLTLHPGFPDAREIGIHRNVIVNLTKDPSYRGALAFRWEGDVPGRVALTLLWFRTSEELRKERLKLGEHNYVYYPAEERPDLWNRLVDYLQHRDRMFEAPAAVVSGESRDLEPGAHQRVPKVDVSELFETALLELHGLITPPENPLLKVNCQYSAKNNELKIELTSRVTEGYIQQYLRNMLDGKVRYVTGPLVIERAKDWHETKVALPQPSDDRPLETWCLWSLLTTSELPTPSSAEIEDMSAHTTFVQEKWIARLSQHGLLAVNAARCLMV